MALWAVGPAAAQQRRAGGLGAAPPAYIAVRRSILEVRLFPKSRTSFSFVFCVRVLRFPSPPPTCRREGRVIRDAPSSPSRGDGSSGLLAALGEAEVGGVSFPAVHRLTIQMGGVGNGPGAAVGLGHIAQGNQKQPRRIVFQGSRNACAGCVPASVYRAENAATPQMVPSH